MPTRLLLAADLLLDVPLLGLGPMPRALFERVRDAPLHTVDALVELAVEHDVDAVLLAGGLSAGGEVDVRALAHLGAACDRLAEGGIPTVVALGPRDRAGLVSLPGRELPPAVAVVPHGGLEAVVVQRLGGPPVAIVVAGAPLGPAEAGRSAASLPHPRVVLATLPPGPPPPLDPAAGVACWALGGAPEPRGGPVAGGGWAVVAAAPQPRVFPRPGPRPGAALLEIDETGAARPPTPLEPAAVRLVTVAVEVGPATSLAEVEERAAAGLPAPGPEAAPVVAQLVVLGEGPARRALGDPSTAAWLLDRLRYRLGETPAWWAHVVLAPLPVEVRDRLAAASPLAAEAARRADEARLGPSSLLAEVRRDAGDDEPVGAAPPAPGWAGLVDEAASLAVELVAGTGR